jgi:hypothetical protein
VVLFLHVTTRIDGERYGDLLSEKGGTGFPWLVFMSPEGDVIAPHDDARSVPGFRRTLDRATRWSAAKAKADGGDRHARADMLFLETELGRMEVVDLEDALAEAGLEPDEAQRKWLLGLKANQQVDEIMEDLRRSRDEGSVRRLRGEMAGLRAAGSIPTGFYQRVNFWMIIAEHAAAQGEKALLEEAIKSAREFVAEIPALEAPLKAFETKLAELGKSGS